MPRRAATPECLDDDHAPAAAWAGKRGWLDLAAIGTVRVVGLLGRFRNLKQLTGTDDVLGPATIGEQAIMADAVEPVGQHVHEEAADELVDVESHLLAPVVLFGAVILPLESDPGIVERGEPAVGDGDAVGIAREVGKHGL